MMNTTTKTKNKYLSKLAVRLLRILHAPTDAVKHLVGRRVFRIVGVVTATMAVFVGLFALFNTSTDATWFSDAWTYRRAITFTHNAEISADRRVTVTINTATLISAGKMQSDCDDARFTDASGTLLRFQLTGTCNNSATTFDVVYPHINNGTNTAYLYYGNATAYGISQDVSSVTSLSPSGGAPSSGSEEVGPAPVVYLSFDEGYGQTAHDATLNANNGQLGSTSGSDTNDPAWQTEDMCVSGKCLYFDGSNDYVLMGNVSLAGDFSVSLWFKANTTSGYRTILSKENSFWVEFEPGGSLRAAVDPGPTQVTYSGVQANRWYHLVVTWDETNNDMYMYLNGAEIGATTSGYNHTTNSNPIRIGSWNGSTEYFHGFMDEVKIHPYARTADQVKAEYNARGSANGSVAQFGPDIRWLSDGLVGYWKMDEASWNGTSGEVLDASGNNHNGTSTGGAGVGSGRFGRGGTFVSAGEYVNIPDNEKLRFDGSTQDFSYFAWVKLDSTGTATSIMGKHNGSSTGWSISTRTAGQVRCRLNTLTDWGTTVLATDNWYHVGCVANRSGDMQIFVNGVLEKSFALNSESLSTTADLRIGEVWSVGPYTDGTIDEARVYNRALTPAEVRALYNWAPGPVGHWKFDEGSGTSAFDSSGNGNNGTMAASMTTSDWVPGKFGTGLDFDGTDDNVDTGSPTITDDLPANAFTFTGWVYLRGLSTSNDVRNVIIGKSSGVDHKWHLASRGTGGSTQWDVTAVGSSTNALTRTSTVVTQDAWQHVTITYDNNASNRVIKLYINGVEASYSTQNAMTGTYSSDASGNLFMASFNNNTNYTGMIADDFKIYNYARTPGQIVEDMNAGHPLGGSPVGSASIYYAFDEMRGTTANNSGALGSGSNGTISSGTWTPSGRINGALTFTASTSVSRTITDPGNINTLSLWVYPTTSAASKTLVTATKLTTNASSQPVYGGCTGTAIPLDTWTHLLVTSNGSGNCAIYQNGVQTATGTTGVTFGTSLNIGASSFTGRIDEFKMYYASFNAEQALIDYNAGSATSMGGVLGDSEADQLIDGAGAPPIGYWKFDEGSGSTLIDYSGNALNGTWNGSGQRYTRGKVGKGGIFNGTNDYVNLGNPSALQLTGATTISAWYKFPSTEYGVHGKIISKQGFSGNRAWDIQFEDWGDDGNGGQCMALQYRIATASNTILSGNYYYPGDSCASAWLDNKWHQVVAVFTPSNHIALYHDGLLVGRTSTSSATQYNSSMDVRVGSAATNSGDFKGMLDEVKIYNYARTPAQIAYDYNRGAPIAHWQFDECSGTTIHDASGNNNHGTLTLGASGQTSAGDCTTNANTAWYNGREGKFNGSLNFDGDDDQIIIADNDVLDVSDQIAISAWIKPDSISSSTQQDRVISKGTDYEIHVSTGDTNCQFSSSGHVQWRLNTGSDQRLCGGTLTIGRWHHVVGIYNGSAQALYIDGNLVASTNRTGAIQTNTNNLIIGGSPLLSPRFFDGQIDDVRIYNYALSEAQIRTIMNYGAVRFGE